MSEHQTEHGRVDYERRDANVWSLLVSIIIGAVILAVISVFLLEWFISEKERLIYDVALSKESTKLRELRARESEILSTYAYVDSAKGIVRIPIDRAMDIMVAEAYEEQQR